MAKVDRQIVWNKYNGHCAYCGKVITINEMQVDHMFPKTLRNHLATKDLLGNWVMPDMDTLDNLMPSCRRCNHYKRAEKLEAFRTMIKTLRIRVMKDYILKVAEDYGQITWTEWDGLFYFEKHK